MQNSAAGRRGGAGAGARIVPHAGDYYAEVSRGSDASTCRRRIVSPRADAGRTVLTIHYAIKTTVRGRPVARQRGRRASLAAQLQCLMRCLSIDWPSWRNS